MTRVLSLLKGTVGVSQHCSISQVLPGLNGVLGGASKDPEIEEGGVVA